MSMCYDQWVSHNRIFAAVTCAVALVGCASKPCSTFHVVQTTNALHETDVELDDGHVYAVPFVVNDDPWNLRPNLDTGDEVQLCVLTATDGSKHYALHLGDRTVKPTLIP